MKQRLSNSNKSEIKKNCILIAEMDQLRSAFVFII